MKSVFQLPPELISRLKMSPKQTALMHGLWVPLDPSNILKSTHLNIPYINNCHRILTLHSPVSQNLFFLKLCDRNG